MEASASDETRALKAVSVFASWSDISLFEVLFIRVLSDHGLRHRLQSNGKARTHSLRLADSFNPSSRGLGDGKLSWSLGKDRGFFTEDELGIAELPHLRKIQTRHLGFRGDPLPHEEFEPQVQKEAEGKDETAQGSNTHYLRCKLA